MRKNIFFILISITIYFHSYGQEWRSGDTKKSFHQIQKEFNEYWKDKKPTKGSGYKQFKRWEHYWENRLMPDGSFPPSGLRYQIFNEYNRNSKRSKGQRNQLIETWTSQGPSSSQTSEQGLGRINCLAFHPTNQNIIYAGAAGGGFWRSYNGGNTWETTTDELGSLGISSIIVNPTNPDIIYIATGDGDAGQNYSIGVLKSTNGGDSWTPTSLDWSASELKLIRKLIFNSSNPDSILIASNDGIWIMTNSGNNSIQKLEGNFFDIEIKPNNNGQVYYCASETKIYKSSDSGENWGIIRTYNQTRRIAIAIAPSNAEYLYAISVASNNGLHRVELTENSGQSFETKLYGFDVGKNILGYYCPNANTTQGQGAYDLALIVDKNNENILYTGGIVTTKSEDKGETWNMVNMWEDACTDIPSGVEIVHADKHALEWNGNVLWEGNDGGVYKSNATGTSWEDKSAGLNISQIFNIGVSPNTTKVIAGLQDNGVKLKSTNWQNLRNSDGVDAFFNNINNSTLYFSLYGGDIYKSTNFGFDAISIKPPGSSNYNFITPFVPDPQNNSKLYVASDKFYKSIDEGDSWTQSGSFPNSVSYIVVSKSNPNYIYVTDSTNIYRTIDNAGTWSIVASPGNKISRLCVHPQNPNIIYALRQNYSSNSQVYKSIDGGLTWSPYSTGLPALPANAIVYQNDSDDLLYIGLDIGVYYRSASMPQWEMYGETLPNVEVFDLEINYNDSKLYAGTFGRGIWSVPIFYCYNTPDLVINNQNVSSLVVQQEGILNLSFHVENIGNVAANPHVISFHLSSDGVLDPLSGNEIYVDEYELVNPIPAQTFHDVVDFPLVIPSSTPPGEYFLFFSVDGGLTVSECREDNNQATKLIVVQENTNTSQAYYRHWFDNNWGSVQTFNTTSTNNIFTINKLLSTNTLSEGLHTLNFQLKDDLWSSITSSFFYKLNNLYPAGNPQYQYWYDNNYSNNYVQSITSTNNLIVLSNLGTSSIQDGLHTFNIRFKPDGKHWTAVNSSLFYKPRNLPIGIPQYEYWLDQNYSEKVSVNNSSTPDFILLSNLDMNDVPAGLHTFNIRFRPQGKAWTGINSSFFYKTTPEMAGQPYYQYWFDNNVTDSVTINIAPTNNLILNSSFNTDNLSAGLHTFNIRFRSDGKKSSIINSSFFYKVPVELQGQPKYQYWFDNNIQDSVTINTASTTNFILLEQINSMQLPEGLHTFNIRFKPTGGKWSVINTTFFVRGRSVNPTEITKCLYWFDEDFNNHSTVLYSGSSNIFDIIYANTPNLSNGEHTISMFFMDNAGYWSSIVKDTFVKDTILPIQCPNNQIFTSGLGNQYILSYQWQVNDGTGYTNISNTSVYNGTNTDTLILSNAPSSWYGYLFRCIVTTNQGTINSAPIPLRFVYYWDGSVDNNWETAGNWNCNIVPGLNADVIINTGNVQVNSNVTISSLTLGSTAEYSVLSNNNFTLTGH